MEASIGEPFSLSNYGLAKLPKGQEALSPVYASYQTASGSSEGYATIAAQGNGVHVFDISSLHPIVSHNCGPTMTFSCPPISEFTVDGTDQICTTYASIASADALLGSISIWKEPITGALTERAAQKRKSVEIPHTVVSLHTSTQVPSRIFALSPQGDLSVLDAEGQLLKSSSTPFVDHTFCQTFVLSRTSCSFLPSQTAPRAAIFVRVAALKCSAQIRVSLFDDQDNLVELQTLEISIDGKQILKVTLSPTGLLSILCPDASWHCYQLECRDTFAIEVNAVADPMRLGALSFVTLPSQRGGEVSLLSCGSSIVLLAAVTATPTRDIVLLLWDMQYSVLLASQVFALPSRSSDEKTGVSLELIPATQSHVLLIITPASGKRQTTASSLRSSILVIPIKSPSKSTIANAMGRASAGAPWLASELEVSGSRSTPYDAGQIKLLADMRSAVQQNRPQAANESFFEWQKREIVDGEKSLEGQKPVVLGYGLVKELLNIVLQPNMPANAIYSSDIVLHLLQRRLVSATMVDFGLLRLLRMRNDWKSIEQAFTTVLDIPEPEIVETLAFVVAHYRQSKSADSMQIDSLPEIPALSDFLRLCVAYSSSHIPMRLAIRRYLSDGDDLVCILEILGNWMKILEGQEQKYLPSLKSLTNNEHGIPVVQDPGKKAAAGGIPSLDNIVTFVQMILDASFVTLVQHQSSHRILKKIQAHIEPQVASLEDSERLRGPLTPFAKFHAQTLRDARDGFPAGGTQGDWRQRKRNMHEQAGIAIGMYQLEELVL
ncbi:hypothetical protein C8J56DRAFT_911837 [Mycena floridula]|nr:hypothetical protein C8J56DRAFT_911837 [Mycena floridula]